MWLAAARVKYNERVTGAVQIDYVASVAATLKNSVRTWCIWIESGRHGGGAGSGVRATDAVHNGNVASDAGEQRTLRNTNNETAIRNQ